MKLSTPMRFVMLRAQAEADALSQKEIFPEHILLGILKIAEMTADEISPASRHKEETDKDIKILRERFAELKINTDTARHKLRRLLKTAAPVGDGAALTDGLFKNAALHAEPLSFYPSHVLRVMKANPTPAIKAVLFADEEKENAAGRNEIKPANGAENPVSDEKGPAFLSALTRRIRNMSYALLENVHGQDHAVHAFADGMFAAEMLAAADENRKRPKAVFVFAGPPGVGKTFLAEQAAGMLDVPYKRFDMSSYADHQAHIPLGGWPPSYHDAKEGLITSFVKKNPGCILLFDEIEKAHFNTINIFLQILDAGRLHDDYLDEDIEFKDTIIIFTTNAGKRLYEGEHPQNAAGIRRQAIINALETDTHPQTDRPFFPAAICSRLAAGYPLMFSHLSAHNLETIGRNELSRCCGLFEKQYGAVVRFDDLLPAALLFAEGGRADARTLRAQSEVFFKNEIFKLCRLWGENIDDALGKIREISFTVDTAGMPENVSALFENHDNPEILLFGDTRLAARLKEAMPDLTVHAAMEKEDAFELLSKTDISCVLLKLVNEGDAGFDPAAARMMLDEPMRGDATVCAFDNVPMAANSLNESRRFFRELRERMPETPVFLLESGDFIIDEELENAFARAGARGKLTAPAQDMGVLAESLTRIAKQLHMQSAAAALAAERKALSFETAPISDENETHVTIRLRELTLRRAADANDVSAVLDEVEKPGVRFSDVVGAENAKDELRFFVQFLKNFKSFAARGLKPPKGVLLYGPPGTGKTLLAKAMAGESDAAFIPTAASGFVTKWQGSGPEAVRELFARARRYAPSIVFIDEIDAIGRARSGGNSGYDEEEMALTALLTEMDGFSVDPKRPVFVLAATNFDVEEGKGGMGVIDPALARRFDRKILVDLPTRDDRRRYLEYMLGKHEPHNVSAVMADRLAGRAAGLSLANLESVMELASRNAAKRGISIDDVILDEAFEVYRHGEEKKWGHEYLERVARHEAGHAYLCRLGGGTPDYLTIVARGGHGGYMEHADTETSPLHTKDVLLDRIRTSLGGRAAELVYYGDAGGVSTGAAGDLESATRIAKAMIIQYGMDDEFGLAALSREEAEKGPLAAEIQRKINVILKEQMKQAVSLVNAGKNKVDNLVAALLDKNKLTRDEIDAILG